MRLDKIHASIVKVAAGDDSRPVLAGLYVQRVGDSKTLGTVSAADGFCAAVVPCTLDENDQTPVIVPQEAFKAAGKAKGPRHLPQELYLDLTADKAVARMVEGTPRFAYIRGDYPDFRGVIPNQDAMGTQPIFAVNPQFLAKVAAALGTETPKIQAPADKQAPWLVHTCAPDANGKPVAPFGLVMPFQVNDEAWMYRGATAAPEADHSACVSQAIYERSLASVVDFERRNQELLDQIDATRACTPVASLTDHAACLADAAALTRQVEELRADKSALIEEVSLLRAAGRNASIDLESGDSPEHEACRAAWREYDVKNDELERQIEQLEEARDALQATLDADPPAHCSICGDESGGLDHWRCLQERKDNGPSAMAAEPMVPIARLADAFTALAAVPVMAGGADEYQTYAAGIVTPAKREFAYAVLAARQAGQADPTPPSSLDPEAARKVLKRLRKYRPS